MAKQSKAVQVPQNQTVVKAGHIIAKGAIVSAKASAVVATSFWAGLKAGWAEGMAK